MAIKNKLLTTPPPRHDCYFRLQRVLSKVAPERSLLEPNKHAGRNNTGKITRSPSRRRQTAIASRDRFQAQQVRRSRNGQGHAV